MKPATHDTDFVFHNDDFVGINLGWDFIAEHEFGIKTLKNRFGIKNNSTIFKRVFGIDNRQISIIPEELFFAPTIYEKKKCFVLALPYSSANKYLVFNKDGSLSKKSFDTFRLLTWRLFEKDSTGVVASWDENTFAICVSNQNKQYLSDLYDAFLKKDIIIMISRTNNPFANGGLCIYIKSKLPEIFIQKYYDCDKKQFELEQAVSKTKIREKLKKAGKEYFDLSPRWDEDGTIKYWLNPYNQDKYNYGWFTLEDLLLWIKDKGPIIKIKEEG